ncbi:MAG: hypothetical protein KBH88_00050 [Bacteroidales bacterium]|jgi:hypothetical protein|nr:hypothetical protein [Bacteroidales bacterium]MBP8676893.1 hypothetical protein [Bacteroidales bacterium]MBP9584147.1 hypothetical protein [Bacteroidales bacterium]
MVNKKRGLADWQALQVIKYNSFNSYIRNNHSARRLRTGDDDGLNGYLSFFSSLYVTTQM